MLKDVLGRGGEAGRWIPGRKFASVCIPVVLQTLVQYIESPIRLSGP
jgi:hypothetical protein